MNDHPKKAIDARSSNQLRAKHSRPFLHTIKDMAIERQCNNCNCSQRTLERDRMLLIYFICFVITHAALIFMQLLALSFSIIDSLTIIGCTSMVLIASYFAISISFKCVSSGLRRVFQKIYNNHSVAQILSFMVASAVMLQIQIIMIKTVSQVSHHEESIRRYRDDMSFCPYVNMNDHFLKLSLLVMVTCALNQILTTMVKTLLILIISGTYVYVTMYESVYFKISFVDYQSRCGLDWVEQWINVVIAGGTALALLLLPQQAEQNGKKIDFIRKLQANDENVDVEHLEVYNHKLLANIFPDHVTQYFLRSTNIDELYYKQCDSVCVMIASIPNFPHFYVNFEFTNEGIECLRLLNEIISEFDEILAEEQFRYIEKIRSIGATYTAASGLTSANRDPCDYRYVTAMADYALRIRKKLNEMNEHSFYSLCVRIGINVGPVVAGVIGTYKPQYDIWGYAVNVASKMDSTGVADMIQITKEVYNILVKYGYRIRIYRGDICGSETDTYYFLDSLHEFYYSSSEMDDSSEQSTADDSDSELDWSTTDEIDWLTADEFDL